MRVGFAPLTMDCMLRLLWTVCSILECWILSVLVPVDVIEQACGYLLSMPASKLSPDCMVFFLPPLNTYAASLVGVLGRQQLYTKREI